METRVALFAVVFVAMLIEARRAARNERAQRARGGVEPPDDVYRLMQVIYPASFLLMLAEGVWRATPSLPIFVAGAAIFVTAKAIKWWAIVTLGPFWTFRVIVVPGSRRVVSGPYRFVPHPNYVAVVGEFIGVGLMTGAVVTGPLTLLAFAALLVRRIAVEERLLRASTH